MLTPPPGFVARRWGARLAVARAEDEPALAPLLARPFAELAARPDARRVAAGRAGPVHLPVPGAARRVFVRPYAHGGWLGPLLGRWFPGLRRALRELAVGERARSAGLPVVPLIAVTGSARGPGRWEMEAWSWWLEGASPLSDRLAGLRGRPEDRNALLAAAADALRACHDGGLRHPDLNARNIVVVPGPPSACLRLVDLDRAALGPPLATPERLRQLARLHRSLVKEGLIPDPVAEPEFAAFAERCVPRLSGGLRSAFLARCRRAARRHALGWRRGRKAA